MDSLLSFSLFITLLSSLPLASSQYTLPDRYFINCGSDSPAPFAGRSFVSDVNPATFSASGDRATTVQNTNPSPDTPPIYQTARIFNKKSWYELQPDPGSTFLLVRLHFYPFSSRNYNLSDSIFDVSVSGFSLLSNFHVPATTIKEFFVPIDPSWKSYIILFAPSNDSSFAFINAIEAFTTPPDLFNNGVSLPHVSPDRNNSKSQNFKNLVLSPVHRINVGGQKITAENDTLRRNWVPDDPFIYNSRPASNTSTFSGNIMYQNGLATRFHAPDNVYRTAKQLNYDSSRQANLINVTWNFVVNKNSSFLVRAHFCDVISRVILHFTFNLYVYSQYAEPISPNDRAEMIQQQLATPFYNDFLVESDDSGLVNISIGPTVDNGLAFLNGVEIMELLLKGSDQQENGDHGSKKTTSYIIVGSVVGSVAVLLVLLIGFLIGLKYRKVKLSEKELPLVPSYGGDSYTTIIDTNGTVNNAAVTPNLNLGLRVPLADILQLTNNFDPKLMIGEGGFGKVYKGTLPNGFKVAVKRAEQGHGQGRPEFVTEILVLSRIRHRHLVSLVGYCDERSEMILVYEFMEKGTLQDHLYGSNNKDQQKLSWNKRLEICISAAQGLHYLHTGSDGGIIHRDVKSTNILLDKHFVAKVADFGISRLDNDMDQSEVNELSEIKGSFGYLDPEYIRCLKLTQKSDVYSFGVVLLEVLCGRPALDNKLPQKEVSLSEWGISAIKKGEIEQIVDPFLAGKINMHSLRKFLETVQKCLKETGDERPNMIDVLWDLEYALQLQQTALVREPHEDSAMSTSLGLPLPVVHRLPSQSIISDDEGIDDDSSSFPSATEVFSQLKLDDAR